MNSNQVPGPVLVGIAADGDNTGALVFAAGEARRLGVQVRLVHAAYQVMPPHPKSVLVSYHSLEEVAAVILSGARHAFAELAPDVLLETPTVSSADSAPVVVAQRLRKGSCGPRGAQPGSSPTR